MMESYCEKVLVSDVGFVRVGDHWEKSLTDLAFDACSAILKGDDHAKPDALVVANALASISSSQQNLGPLIADTLELGDVEAFGVEASGASGAAAVHIASSMIRSGQAKKVLVVGVEKMRDMEPSKVLSAQGLSEHAEYSQFFGISFASLNALIARMYMATFNVDRAALSAFPVIAHRNSSTAEHAQFKKKFSAEDVSRSEIVSDPLRVLDCAPVGDGAAAVLLASESASGDEERSAKPSIVASELASGRVNFFEREDPLRFGATVLATEKALKKSGLQLEDIDFFEIHDAYSIEAALCVEAIGLAKRGHACREAATGKFDMNGQHPISTFGGLKGRGYPIGASGVYQLCEAFLQLTQRAGFNQMLDARRGLIQTMSGIDGSSYVHIVESNSSAL